MSFFDERSSPESDLDRPGSRRVGLVLAMLVLLAAAGYVALHHLSVARVPLGTNVDGVSVGGMTRADAERKLERDLAGDLGRRITFTHQGHSYPFAPRTAGVSIDYAATVMATGADDGRWAPKQLWGYFTGGRDTAAVVRFRAQPFSDALDALTARIGRPAVEGTVEFRDGRAIPVYGQTGLAVNHALAQALVAKLIFDSHPAELPISVRAPYISPAAVRAALHDFAEPAMSGDVDVIIGGHKVVAPPRLFGTALTMIPNNGKLVPLVNGKQLVAALAPVMTTIGAKPRDATVQLRGGRPVVVPAVYGASYDVDELAAAFPAAVVQPAGRRVLQLHAAITNPHRTTSAARALGVRTRLGQFTVPGSTALASALDGALLVPGQSLKLSARVDAPSRPLATGLFTAALRAGLAIPSYTPSTAYDPSLPAGRQMTDVEITAGQRFGVLVTATQTGKGVRVAIWSTRDSQVEIRVGRQKDLQEPSVVDSSAADCVPRAGQPGFAITVRRRVTPLASAVAAPFTRFVSNYLPVPTLVCVPPPSPSTPASP